MSHILMHIARIFLGVIFMGAGLNGYFVILGLEPFIPTSPEAMLLFQFSYLLIAEKSLEMICGLLLIVHRFVPLALAVLTPIVINIFLFHLFLDHSLLLLAVLLSIACGYMMLYYKNNFRGIFENRRL